jgi:hypothetical protein
VRKTARLTLRTRRRLAACVHLVLAITLGVFAVAVGAGCAALFGAAGGAGDVAEYEREQLACVDQADARAGADSCRAAVRARYCAPGGALYEAGACALDAGPPPPSSNASPKHARDDRGIAPAVDDGDNEPKLGRVEAEHLVEGRGQDRFAQARGSSTGPNLGRPVDHVEQVRHRADQGLTEPRATLGVAGDELVEIDERLFVPADHRPRRRALSTVAMARASTWSLGTTRSGCSSASRSRSSSTAAISGCTGSCRSTAGPPCSSASSSSSLRRRAWLTRESVEPGSAHVHLATSTVSGEVRT